MEIGMFFETKHSLKENEFSLIESSRMDFPIHIHRSFEYFEQINGSTEMLIGSKKYILCKGEAVLVFPLQPHSYACIEDGEIKMSIFSPDLVSSFYKTNKSKLPTDNKFLCSLSDGISADTLFHQKSIAYYICGEFEKGREYVDASGKLGDQLFVSLLLFADKNFKGKCLLRDAAVAVGYDYAYISKFFKFKAGMSFRQYVNRLRIIESKQLLKSTEKGIEEISELCGFSSLRAFDREFNAQTGMTPTNYKNINHTV